jgi:hypothetical protein
MFVEINKYFFIVRAEDLCHSRIDYGAAAAAAFNRYRTIHCALLTVSKFYYRRRRTNMARIYRFLSLPKDDSDGA